MSPSALLSIAVLKERAAFDLNQFLDGKVPRRDEIAVAQNLVSLQ